jgi:hypothetical protein
MELISDMDRAILSLPRSLDSILLSICQRLKTIIESSAAGIYVLSGGDVLPVSTEASPDWETALLTRHKDRLRHLGRKEHLICESDYASRDEIVVCVPVFAQDRIFGVFGVLPIVKTKKVVE